MFKLDSEEALLSTFRPKDRARVELAPEVTFPLVVRGYFAWANPAGGRVYLVFAVPGGIPVGIAFDTQGGAGPSVPNMCDWCQCMGQGTQVGLLAARVNAKKRVGVNVCTDLGCRQKLEDEANRSGRSVVPAMEKLVARMGRFASSALGIDLAGANR